MNESKDCRLSAAEKSLRELIENDASNRILRKEWLGETVVLLELDNPLIARSAKAGQFVIVRADRRGERIPLTISDFDRERGTITIIFQIVGQTTAQLSRLEEGDFVPDVCGPLGKPSEVKNYGTAVCIGGGVGIAFLRPIVKALKEVGCRVISILGAREKGLLILEDEMRKLSDELLITTDDGSYGKKGLVTDVLKELLDSGGSVDVVFAIGPTPMMRAVSETTRPYSIKTIVSLDPIMIDGTGMCGGCRVTVGGKTQFTCVDGPDFDGHLVDWEELKIRKAYYSAEEKIAKDLAFGGEK
jgi:ferredoxin--NADP+ reductase